MGCSGNPSTVEKTDIIDDYIRPNPVANDNNNQNEDIIHILYLKMTKLIIGNPFYKTPLDTFKQLNIFDRRFNNIDDILNEMISMFYEKQESFVQNLFKYIVKYSYIKFKVLMPYENEKDIIKLILNFLYIFLSEPQPGKKELFYENLKSLLIIVN